MKLLDAEPASGRRRVWLWVAGALVILVVALIAAYELIASPLQAMLLASYGKRLTFNSQPGPSNRVRFPEQGPFDIRLGYTLIPRLQKRLAEQGYGISQQARVSREMAKLADFGLFLPYREKSSAGLDIRDCIDTSIYKARIPRRTYLDFDAIPPVVANTLLYIENRELLDPNHPQRNPAVEWDRLAQAVLEKAVQVFSPGRNVPGGSTLATQIEKYRHSPDGLTMTAMDKLSQMASASTRAYLDGTDTRFARQRIVLDYLNTVPLAAAPGFGEVHGIGDGLEAWFGLNFDQTNAVLLQAKPSIEAARAYKHVLGLLISQRKPSWYLLGGRKNLDGQVNFHLDLLAEAGVISPALCDMAKTQRITFKETAKNNAENHTPPPDFTRSKATTALRTELSQLLGIPRFYDLDRLDLRVQSTLHEPTQKAVTDTLKRLTDPAFVAQSGLYGEHLLSPSNDLSKILYSFTLYELSEDGALLRVQADNLDQPFDINQGAKLDMGSSAKLRTLITYLGLISELHYQYAALDSNQLNKVNVAERDTLTRWAVDYLSRTQDKSLEPMLDAAMGRTYSANPNEAFWTGGGLHYFANFNKEDNGRVLNLWEATRNSVNLPFIRLMRDIVRHLVFRNPSMADQILSDVDNPERRLYLQRFADKEGKEFLLRFYHKYKGLKPQEATDALLNHLSANPRRLAVVFRYLEPNLPISGFTKLMQQRLTNPERFDSTDFEKLYTTYGPESFSLSDRAYIAQLHPLELWLVAYMRQHPEADWKALAKASLKERLDVYEWLYKSGRKGAQDSRIQSLLEIEAFQEIHKRWRRLGYPFSSLVPSYASAIGSSADRPAALAELLGVIRNDGIKLPPATLQRLEFAEGTPYHTVFQRKAALGERIIPAALARVVRKALINVVQDGTARRLRGVFKTATGELVVGGKTGTGDHRKETFSASGALLESKVMNRVATFAFFLGDYNYGVITAFVPGEAAGNYRFTSGLPVQLLKILAPILLPALPIQSWESQAQAFEDEGLPPPKRAATSVTPPPAPETALDEAFDAPDNPAVIPPTEEMQNGQALKPALNIKILPAQVNKPVDNENSGAPRAPRKESSAPGGVIEIPPPHKNNGTQDQTKPDISRVPKQTPDAKPKAPKDSIGKGYEFI